MNPTAADRFRLSPRIHSEAIPPTIANGTFSRISRACELDLNVAKSSPKIMVTDSGTTNMRRFMARS
jgi:hypothetical protein